MFRLHYFTVQGNNGQPESLVTNHYRGQWGMYCVSFQCSSIVKIPGLTPQGPRWEILHPSPVRSRKPHLPMTEGSNTYPVTSQHISLEQCSGFETNRTVASPDGHDLTAGRFVSVGSRLELRSNSNSTSCGICGLK